jgi:peptidyl-prolyl cis-trans isomerase C
MKYKFNWIACFYVVLIIAVINAGYKTNAFSAENKSTDKNINVESPNPDQIVVEVNRTKLTKSQLDKILENQINVMIKRGFPQARINQIRGQLEKRLVDDFVNRTLMRQESENQKIEVSEPEINRIIEGMKKSLPEGMSFENALKTKGMALNKLHDDIKNRLIAEKLMQKNVKLEAEPSKKAIQQYYSAHKKDYETPEMVHARHILIKVNQKDDEKMIAAKKARAETLRQKLLDGADFAKIARENSDCPSKEMGGELGAFPRGKMMKTFENAAFSQKINEIGPVVETTFGYHIIKVTEHNDARLKSFDDVKKEIKNKLIMDQKIKAWSKYLGELKEKSAIIYGKDFNKSTIAN